MGLGCFITFFFNFTKLISRHLLSQESENYGSPYYIKEETGFRTTMSSAIGTMFSCGVFDTFKGKAIYTGAKPTLVARRTFVSFRRANTIASLGYTLCKKDGVMRVYYSTEMRSNSMSTLGINERVHLF